MATGGRRLWRDTLNEWSCWLTISRPGCRTDLYDENRKALGGMLMFTRLDHVAYAVKDPEKSAEFYKKHFGFKKIYEEDIPVPYFQEAVYLKLNDIILELFRFKSDLPDVLFHFCLYSDDFDRDFARLKGEGIPIDLEPHLIETNDSKIINLKRAVLVGPDGELIEIRG
jgi:lactoylglutathione lyase